MTNPKYQDIKSDDIPVLEIGKYSMLRLISGEYENENGAASTFTKINLYDLISKSEDEISISLSSGTNSILLILNGEITLSENKVNNIAKLSKNAFDLSEDGVDIITISRNLNKLGIG